MAEAAEKLDEARLLDNPLRREFLTFEQVVDFFGYSKRWVRQQMTEGNLPYRPYGRDKVIFYIPDVRQAILSGALAPIRKRVQGDNSHQNKKRGKISSSSEGQGFKTLQELRDEKRGREMGELYSFPEGSGF